MINQVFKYLYNADGQVTEMFLESNIRLDAVRQTQDNPNAPEFWQVYLLPDHPTGRKKFMAQCSSMEEAQEAMLLLGETLRSNMI